VPNITIENIDTNGVVLSLESSADGALVNADAEDPATFVAGTILARHSSTLKFHPFDPAGANGLNVAKAVLTYDVGPVAAASEAAVRVLVQGKVNAGRLAIHDGTTITVAHLDGLRDYGIVAETVQQLSRVDNPQ
jgi:hypothetical protein